MKSIYRLFILGLFAVSTVACFESKSDDAAENTEAVEAVADPIDEAVEESGDSEDM